MGTEPWGVAGRPELGGDLDSREHYRRRLAKGREDGWEDRLALQS